MTDPPFILASAAYSGRHASAAGVVVNRVPRLSKFRPLSTILLVHGEWQDQVNRRERQGRAQRHQLSAKRPTLLRAPLRM